MSLKLEYEVKISKKLQEELMLEQLCPVSTTVKDVVELNKDQLQTLIQEKIIQIHSCGIIRSYSNESKCISLSYLEEPYMSEYEHKIGDEKIVVVDVGNRPHYIKWDKIPYFDEALSLFLAKKREYDKERERLIEISKKSKEAFRAKKEVFDRAEAVKREALKKKELEEKERLEKEKMIWIEEHGSEILKNAIKLGHDCTRQYLTERAEKEFPGYYLDFDSDIRTKERTCPTSLNRVNECLELVEKGINASIVWLPDGLDGREPHEAIEISNFLGKFLYKF